ncbi:Rv3235 family protein [Streptomyces doebereineriae]|uniref:Rv3235 family protein n=1 Tax=Streptomyces doebereineriae TaxID=3075528 RepID=A0ABU2VH75_9ACTN|nr:Rv3235 family protein [Streptomyces sp. DSM 41640]MDT0484942.1 Rv3235 family protein [Streptomyces sp. DSM 41640]
MNKVMTRAQHHPGIRPPARRDSRRPGGTPPRTPGGSAPRTAPGDGRPPGSPGSALRARTRPTDTRPQGTPGRNDTTTGAPRRSTTAGPRPVGTTDTAATAGSTPSTRVAAALADGRTAAPATAPVVPSQTPRRPRVPQPRPTDLFADLLLAVLSGQRPVHSMLRHTAGRAYDELAWLAERGPLRTHGTRPVVRDIGYYVPRPGAVEAFARIGAGDQLRAMAFRLEQGQDLRWRCTAVELGGSRAPRPDDD